MDTNPYAFIHIINPEYKAPKSERTKANSYERFCKTRERYREWKRQGIFERDDRPCLYLYRQQSGEKVYTGIIAGISIDDYFKGIIKVHEQTLTKREQVFKKYLDVCKFNAEPVLLTYPDNSTIDGILSMYMAERPKFDFTNTDRVRHTLWLIDEQDDISRITQVFDRFKSIYIADGHHRSASSALFGKAMREEEERPNPNAPYNYFMSCFIPESQLDIYDFNRVVKDLNGYTPKELLVLLESQFEVVDMGENPYQPEALHNFGMYLDSRWYSLSSKEGTYDPDHPVSSLDSHILTENILSPLLNVKDLKTDKRIEFIGGLKGIDPLQKHVDSGKSKVAFALYPVTVQHMKWVADTGNTMPPKTTWIEPKMRSGLTIFEV